MGYFFLTLIIIRLLLLAASRLNIRWNGLLKPWRKQGQYAELFSGNYIEVKAFYIQEFKQTPCVIYMSDIDTAKAFAYVREGLAGKVKAIYQRNYYNWKELKTDSTLTIFKLSNNLMIELGYDYAEILYGPGGFDAADKLVNAFAGFKAVPKEEEDHEINIINYQNREFCLKRLDIKPAKLDVGKYYNDDFAAVDALIRKRLMSDNDKGIVLLHGLPGTGKTSYLRYLIGTLKKKVLFLSPSVAGNLMDPEFIDLLIDNTNCVLVIEDAENIIMDRKYNSNSSVSNLLNISDGLLSDCLNVQIVCTFNSSLNLVDEALMRKGRLIARYEFGKLETAKAQVLSNELGYDRIITRPMTLAEITNPDETICAKPQVSIMGFRRELIEN